MKTTKTLVAMLAGIALFSFTVTTQAQYKITTTDGITASPKARQTLDANKLLVAPAVPASTQMACASCQDKLSQRVDYTVRGAVKPAVQVTTHLCKSCKTNWTTTGFGKTRQVVASHKCGDPGIRSCD